MQPTFNPRRRALVFLATALSVVGLSSVLHAAPQAANVITVYKLGTPAGSGTNPRGDLVLASDGNFYAATFSGGTSGAGAILQITPAGAVTVLHSLAGGSTEGATPYGGLIEGTDGDLYGTTYLGGGDSLGTVFKVTKAGTFTNLHSFDNAAKGGFLGYTGVVQAPDGDLYGTTLRGGDNDMGTVYKTTTSGTFTQLFSFGGDDGKSPEGRLALGPDGALYGTTLLGGTADRGTIYKITTSGTQTTLYSFAALGAFTPAGVAVNPDGANPRAGLVLGTDGNFYGTSYQGGAFGYGTVFRLTPAGAITTLHSFEGAPYDGASPLAAVSLGADGSLYGTTERGGYSGQGTAWQIDAAGQYRLLHAFSGLAADGAQIYTTLVPLGGFLYGAAYTDNSAGTGVLYKLDPGTGGVLPLVFGVLPETIELGASATLTYSSPAAASCTAAGTNWTDAITTSGAKTLTPTTAGIYTYIFTCKDGADVSRSAYASLVVTAPEAKPVDGGGDGGGGALSWLTLALLGGASLISAWMRKRLDHERA